MYTDPIIQKYLDLLKDNTTRIKGFYNGFVSNIPASMLPAIMINIETTEAGEFSDIEDEHRIGLVLTYIGDIRQTFNDSSLVTVLNNVLDGLVGREEEISSTPYALKTDSVLYVLRNNLNVDSDNNLRTDINSFSIVTPSEISTGRFQGFYSAEGTIKFNAHFTQQR